MTVSSRAPEIRSRVDGKRCDVVAEDDHNLRQKSAMAADACVSRCCVTCCEGEDEDVYDTMAGAEYTATDAVGKYHFLVKTPFEVSIALRPPLSPM